MSVKYKVQELNRDILRANDIRGIYGTELDEDQAYSIGRAFGKWVKAHAGTQICVGRDGRLSSPALEDALIAGLTEEGLDILKVGVGPSPMILFAEEKLQVCGSVMVTASHNPSEYNGFKLNFQKQPLYGDQIFSLAQHCYAGMTSSVDKGNVTNVNIFNTYVDMLVKKFQSHYHPKKELKIAWDPGHGAAAEVVTELVRQLPGQHVLINNTIDGRFPAHHPDPTKLENLAQLVEIMKKENCDLGFAFDGDGDRFGVIDEDGHRIDGDQLLLFYAEELLSRMDTATIIFDVKVSSLLTQRINARGGRGIMWKTGRSLIRQKMLEEDALMAGEMSAHYFFRDQYFGFDDAIYAGVRLMGILVSQDQTLAGFRNALPAVYNTPEIRQKVPEGTQFEIVDHVAQDLKKQGKVYRDIDGIRYETDDGWWLLRASNTESQIVMRVEANSLENVRRLQKELDSYL